MKQYADVILAYSIMLGLIILVGFLQSWSIALSIMCFCLISAVPVDEMLPETWLTPPGTRYYIYIWIGPPTTVLRAVLLVGVHHEFVTCWSCG